eukprot:TRINITY_DN9748_c0_g2_i1.p2 TRINITY_DN9748_c0_g2~~TRINITY_DN9748_c0_g2_i1.p2  ORF type:complete len:208 (+),score=21.68 TRINITY_DN9748_c0_g2_i1:312-935(+)
MGRQFSQQNINQNIINNQNKLNNQNKINSASPVKRKQNPNNESTEGDKVETLKQFLYQINDDRKIKEIQLKLQQGRQKSLQPQEINRLFIFDGLAYVQAQGFIRNDVDMQSNLLKSLIRVIIDKGNAFKANIIIQKEILDIFCNISQQQQINFNRRLESLITLINQISLILFIRIWQLKGRIRITQDIVYGYINQIRNNKERNSGIA